MQTQADKPWQIQLKSTGLHAGMLPTADFAGINFQKLRLRRGNRRATAPKLPA